MLEHGEPFFARHGPKAVFLGRWVSGLRIASAWLAGMNKMAWPTFLFWNALGGIAWAASIGLGVYFLGHVAEQVISTAGPAAAVVGVLALVAFLVWRHRRAARMSEAERLTAADQDAFEAACHLAFHEVAHPEDIAMYQRVTEPRAHGRGPRGRRDRRHRRDPRPRADRPRRDAAGRRRLGDRRRARATRAAGT